MALASLLAIGAQLTMTFSLRWVDAMTVGVISQLAVIISMALGATFLGEKITMIFQEPMTSLDPVYRVGEQIAEALRLHRGLDRAGARARVVELLELVGVALFALLSLLVHAMGPMGIADEIRPVDDPVVVRRPVDDTDSVRCTRDDPMRPDLRVQVVVDVRKIDASQDQRRCFGSQCFAQSAISPRRFSKRSPRR